ncbi:hypothetical protein HYY75_05310 [bacterium]|nr:hypothetical protein [bacterium]
MSLTSFSPPRSLSEFLKTLENLRTLDSYIFPWFEPFYDRNTLFRLKQAISGNILSNSAKQEVSTRSKEFVSFIHQALNRKLLNPLSMEADGNLSYEVFEAGDSTFSTFWILQSELIPNTRSSKNSDVRFTPFPGKTDFSPIPRMTFRLLTPTQSFAEFSEKHFPPNEITFGEPQINISSASIFFDCDPLAEGIWMKDFAPSIYEKLLNGDAE